MNTIGGINLLCNSISILSRSRTLNLTSWRFPWVCPSTNLFIDHSSINDAELSLFSSSKERGSSLLRSRPRTVISSCWSNELFVSQLPRLQHNLIAKTSRLCTTPRHAIIVRSKTLIFTPVLAQPSETKIQAVCLPSGHRSSGRI